ncbi:carboxypeptidase-like regulatory domain-containing protein [Flavobacterium selenitireducens]|uniref:carboxypeptidase-like regulatory domain-containing protein n=1 Tax=Flavobacterium selenitireducens TaxID=2722704 RepID=UPI00168B4572|nr:carboxypeptidase-like regulatory domain-containing protein [Flavobacterium selenitireducens]MBD3583301.1 carboxypeptidase regulatory-like domain-containing protein [Flavobacterium selenitireducens]
MSAKITKITTTLFLMFSGLIIAQQSLGNAFSTTEKIVLHTNATTLVSGETLYYKLYCQDAQNKPGQLSKIAYVCLVDSQRNTVFIQKLYLENGVAQGDFFVPSSLTSGSYKLVGYTKWMTGQPKVNYPQLDVAIVNPFAPADKAGSELSFKTMRLSSAKAAIAPKKSSWATREKVELGISVPSKGHYSLSVRRKDSLFMLFPEMSASAQNTFVLSESTVLPELRGESISGKVSSKSGNSVKGVTVSLSFPGKDFTTKVIDTRPDGSFTFTLDKPYFQQDAIVQVGGANRQDYLLVLDKLPQPDFSRFEFQAFPVTASAKNAIAQRAVATQIENAYFARKKDSIPAFASKSAFYAPSGTVFKLDEYTRFPTFAETLTEVVEGTFYTKNGDKYSVSVRENILGYDPVGGSMVIVDGIWLPDPTELFDYPAKNIDRITAIPGTYYLGSQGFNGLVSVQTKDGNYEPKSKGDFIRNEKLPRPFPAKRYFAPDHAAPTDRRIPDYRYQLAWIPDFSGDEPTIGFYASDVKGVFEAVLEGVSEEGTPVFATAEFEVK